MKNAQNELPAADDAGEAGVVALQPARRKFMFEDWRDIHPLMRQPEIDFDAVDTCLQNVFGDRKQLLSQARLAVRAIRDHLEGRPFDLSSIKMIEAKPVLSFIAGSGHVDVARDFVKATQKQWDEKLFSEAAAGLFPPNWNGGRPEMVDRQWMDYQIFDRGSKTTLLLFGGLGGHFGMELNALLMWLQSVDCNIIIMRDSHRFLFFSGIKSIGNFDETLAAIKEDVRRLGTERVVCMGSSGGGYNALLFGHLLKADEVLSFAGPTSLDYGIDNADDRPMYARLSEKIARGELVEPNLVEDYRQNGIPVRIYHGALMPRDSMEANRFADLPNATVHAIPRWGRHHVYAELARRGLLADILASIAKRD